VRSEKAVKHEARQNKLMKGTDYENAKKWIDDAGCGCPVRDAAVEFRL
jgi:hypothetical protein